MSRLSLILISIVFVAAGAHADDSPEQVVRSYIQGYSEGLDTSELVGTFWLPNVVLYSAGQQPNPISATEWAAILEAYRGQIREQGWLRTEILDLAECKVREDQALVSLRYQRQFENGTKSMDAVLYLLTRSDGWRISSVMPTDTDLLVACSEPE